MDIIVEKIPDSLVYEMWQGESVYYRGYKDYLKGTKKIEDIIGSSYFQGSLASQLLILLSRYLDNEKYRFLSNEIGLQMDKKSWRAADIAICEKSQLKGIPLDNKYLTVPPKVVIEIDTKANLDAIKNPLGYFQEKTEQLFQFGIEKVIWIFSDTEKVMLAETGLNWEIMDWYKDVLVLEDCVINIGNIVDDLIVL